MQYLRKEENIALKLLLLFMVLVFFFWLMAFFDVLEWFYEHSRKYEHYDYDELVLFLTLLFIGGVVWLGLHFYWKAKSKTEDAAERLLRGSGLAGPETQEQTVHLLLNSYKSPVVLMLSLILVIGIVEILDMYMIHKIPTLPFHLEAYVDAGFLIVVITPVLYFIYFRPFLQQITLRELAEEKLKQLNRELEERVKIRTNQLQQELEKRKRTEAIIIQHQTELRSLATQLSMLEERERKRIATELHDNIGHSLAIVNNRLEFLRASSAAEQEAEIQDIKKLITESIRFTRNLSSELCSPLMEDLPLVSALNWLAEEILESNDILFSVTAEGESELSSSEIRTILMKAVKEILINVVKHAEANYVEIIVGVEGHDIVLEIRDDGKGFNVAEVLELTPSRKRGIGLFNIQEQLANINRDFVLTSNPEQGTVVTLSVPIHNMDKSL